MDNAKLKEILKKHEQWLDGEGGECADLAWANLGKVDLRRANLTGANLTGANLTGVLHDETTSFLSLQCPGEGAFIGYKKCQDKIVKLQITENAKRSSATSRKCRCSEALVLEIQGDLNEIASDRNPSFIYKVGEIAKVEDFDQDRWNECSSGIHFFITREEAENY